MTKFTVLSAAVAVLGWPALAPAAETKVELKNVHMCCPGCAEAVEKILKKVEGVTSVTVDQEAATAKFTAADAKAAQKALDTLAAEGFHGDTGGAKDFAFKDDSGVKPGQVKSLTVTSFHNSCPGCAKAFKAAIKDVKGVTGDTVKSRVTTCEVTGEFDAAELVKALNKAGFHVKVKQ
jgi:periplasmic mercuric ion binding protein